MQKSDDIYFGDHLILKGETPGILEEQPFDQVGMVERGPEAVEMARLHRRLCHRSAPRCVS
jgi:hypothetical protein